MAQERYRQLFERLKSRILASEFDETPFPSEGMVARDEGLSRATVHKAFLELRRQGLIVGGVGRTPRILRSVGRTPRILRSGGARKIGLLVSGIGYSEFFQPVVHEILTVAQAAGYVVMLGDVSAVRHEDMAAEARRFARRLVAEKVSGVICQPFEFLTDSERCNRGVLKIFDEAGVPVVLLGYDIVQPPEHGPYDVVGINNFDAGACLARHLLAAGAKRIHFAMTASSLREPSCTNRIRGIVSVLEDVSFGQFMRHNVLTDALRTPEALRRHLRRGRPDAFIGCNDVVAASLVQQLGALGVRVPDDMLVGGFDDVSIARLVSPSLTSVRQPCGRIAQTVFRRLVQRIAEPDLPPAEILLPAPLVIRRSSGLG